MVMLGSYCTSLVPGIAVVVVASVVASIPGFVVPLSLIVASTVGFDRVLPLFLLLVVAVLVLYLVVAHHIVMEIQSLLYLLVFLQSTVEAGPLLLLACLAVGLVDNGLLRPFVVATAHTASPHSVEVACLSNNVARPSAFVGFLDSDLDSDHVNSPVDLVSWVVAKTNPLLVLVTVVVVDSRIVGSSHRFPL